MTTDPIEQLKRLVEVRAKMIKARGEDATFDATMEGMSAIIRTDLPAILAAWEVDRADIERLDKCHMDDLRTIIDLQQTLGEAQSRIAKLEAVVEAAKDMLAVFEMQDNASEPGTDDFDVVSLVRTALSALEGGQHDPE
jgi:hypothetical protein